MSDINMSLLKEFIEESREYLDEMETLLLSLSSDLGNTDLLNDIFRTMHNIKGGSQLTGLDKVSRISHRFEDLLDLLRQGDKETTDEIVETLIAGRDKIVQLLNELEESQQEISPIDEMIETLTGFIEGTTGESKIDEGKEDGAVEPVANDTDAEVAAAFAEFSSDAITQIGDADYNEENDQELFGIFTEHLQEQLNYLAAQIALMEGTPNKAEGLNRCIDVIKGLRSSANYMGYADLTQSYDAWESALDYAHQTASRDETVSLDFMDDYFDELVRSFPQIEDPRMAAAAPGTAMDAGTGDDITSSVFDAFNDDDSADSVEAATDAVTEETIGGSASDIRFSMLGDFIDESREYLDEMEALLLKLSDDLGNTEILDDIFRTMHNIKGGSQLTGLRKVSALSHRLEDLLDLLRTGEKNTTPAVIEMLIGGRDLIVKIVSELEHTQEETSSVDAMVAQVTAMIEGSESVEGASAAPASQGSTVDSDVVGFDTDFDYSEENDQELLGIFIEHMRSQLVFLTTQTAQIHDASDKVDRLTRCSEAVRSLQSSANYMDYTDLTRSYEAWNTVIGQASEAAARGEDFSLDFMHSYFDKLLGIFTQIEDPRTATNVVTPDVAPNAAEPAAAPMDKTPAAPSVGEAHEQASEEQDNALFEQLNNALDATLQTASDSERGTLNDVFDEMLSSQKSGGSSKQATPKKAAAVPPQQKAPVPQEPAKSAVAKQSATKKVTDKVTARLEANKKMEAAKKEAAAKAKAGEKSIKKSIRVDADKIDTLMNQVGELVVDRSYFFQLFNEMRELQAHLKDIAGIDPRDVKLVRAFTYKLSEAITGLGRTSNDLQEGVMKMRMLPISHIFNRYPRLVHDLTNKTDKKVNLVVRGEDTELDKMIVEEISDPMLHIIRNAIDHGLEGAEERLREGKSETCTLVLEAYQESNHIVIEITDDGRGIDLEQVKAKALDKGLYLESEIEKMTPRDLTNIILMPGFSTAEKITGTSGRGVGMDVVKRNIEKLNGMLEIETSKGKGTRMRLKIPLTLAIIHALMVRVGSDSFTIPLANVDETVRINKSETSMMEGVEVIHLRGVALPIFRLSNIFNVKSNVDLDKSYVVIVSAEGKRVGFVVDELMGQEEVVIKPLADYVQDKSGFSGATIIGDGNISLILDIYELVKMTAKRQARHHSKQNEEMKKDIAKRRNGGKEVHDQY